MRLFNPCFIMDYIPNGRSVYPIFFSKLDHRIFSRYVFASDFFRYLKIQFGVVLIIFCPSTFRTVAAFFHHIVHVVLMSSKEKMVRIYAWSIVTMMQNKLAFWDITTKKNPRYSMCQSIFCYFSNSFKINAPVAISIFRPCPSPTPIGFFANLLQKPFFHIERGVSYGT